MLDIAAALRPSRDVQKGRSVKKSRAIIAVGRKTAHMCQFCAMILFIKKDHERREKMSKGDDSANGSHNYFKKPSRPDNAGWNQCYSAHFQQQRLAQPRSAPSPSPPGIIDMKVCANCWNSDGRRALAAACLFVVWARSASTNSSSAWSSGAA